MSVNPDECDHSIIVFGTMCAICGKDVGHIHSIAALPQSKDILISKEEALKNNANLENALKKDHKLALVVDLDKTLIDTIHVSNEEEAQRIIAQNSQYEDDFMYFAISEIYLVRFRPLVREFLEDIVQKYILYLYTLSQRIYAEKILQKLDPGDKFFHKRILCRDDGTGQSKKSISNFFPCSDKFAVVLDDSHEVWSSQNQTFFTDTPDSEYKKESVFPGLIQIDPFHFFTIAHDDVPAGITPNAWNDKTLKRMGRLLTKINEKFYDENAEHVLMVITDLKLSVFEGCHFYFDGFKSEKRSRWIDFYMKKAQEFGAIAHYEFVPYITHVVVDCSDIRTDSPGVSEALKYKGIHIVPETWFHKCYGFYKRFKESKFPIKGITSPTEGELERSEPPQETELSQGDFDNLFDGLSNSDEEDKEEDKEDPELEKVDISFLEKDSDDDEFVNPQNTES